MDITTERALQTRDCGILAGSDLLRLVDPCYVGRDGEITGPFAEVSAPGVMRWHARAIRADVGMGWGERNLRLELIADAPEPGDIHLPWEEVGGAAVDSGRMCAWAAVEGAVPDDIDGYSMKEPRMISPAADGMARGVDVTAGLGDGWYPVEVRRATDGRVRAVRVVFIDESELEIDEAAEDPPPF